MAKVDEGGAGRRAGRVAGEPCWRLRNGETKIWILPRYIRRARAPQKPRRRDRCLVLGYSIYQRPQSGPGPVQSGTSLVTSKFRAPPAHPSLTEGGPKFGGPAAIGSPLPSLEKVRARYVHTRTKRAYFWLLRVIRATDKSGPERGLTRPFNCASRGNASRAM